MIILLVPLVILVVLALPPALLERSLTRFFVAAGLSFFIVLLPLFVFALSCYMIPEWKGGATFGWASCLMAGKIALTPLVLWAVAALYAVEVWRVSLRTAPWIVRGLMAGAMVSGVCCLYGFVMIIHGFATAGSGHGILLWLIVPFYVAAWYAVRLAQTVRGAPLQAKDYLVVGFGSAPFWLGTVLASRAIYDSLPDAAPSCFVVTAAGRGHEALVGPFVEVHRNGRVLRANQQLLTLWEFEALWRAHAPRSHGAFRSAYNFLGPKIAGKIALPCLADVAYLAIKPAELLAASVLVVARITRPVMGAVKSKP